MIKFDVKRLTDWATELLVEQETDADKAASIATTLIEGDLLGHDTHGLALLGPYLGELQSGRWLGQGHYDRLAHRPAIELWDGKCLPGPWLTCEAIRIAGERARDFGSGTITIRRAGHIACLASYLEKPARAGQLVEIFCSDPSVCSVAPFGGKTAVFTPNPIAFGIPTSHDPILIDISTSITTNGMSGRLAAAGKRFPGTWLLDADGQPSDDPQVFQSTPPGTIQLLGGMDAGHKGYGLSLLVEALTGGLAGYGRADGAQGWGATVMVRVTDTAAFSGQDAFNLQLDWLAKACLDSAAIDPDHPVRLPGQRGLERKRDALANGLQLNPLVHSALDTLAQEMQKPLPT